MTLRTLALVAALAVTPLLAAASPARSQEAPAEDSSAAHGQPPMELDSYQLVAGSMWRGYCCEARKARTRVVADFLIGAHALHQAEALLCRDRGYDGQHFGGLRLLDPSRPGVEEEGPHASPEGDPRGET